jgi:hypothetical protein
MKAELTKEHAFLQKLVGNWEMLGETTDVTPDEHGWQESVRSLHGIWFLAEGHGKMPDGADASSLLTLGYDPAKGKYVGSWIGSMMNHMWVYEGALDADGRTLLLDTTGPDFENEGQTARYREHLAFEDDDNRTFSSHVMTPEGSWRQFMMVRYRRTG